MPVREVMQGLFRTTWQPWMDSTGGPLKNPNLGKVAS